MKNLPRMLVGFIAGVLLIWAKCDALSAADLAAADLAAAEADVRKADADWVATASKGADAWMFFYTADAIVLLPNEQLANGADLVRRGVSRLLALPHLAVAWHPTNVRMNGSGDVAYVTAVFELRFDDSHGAAVVMRGSLLKIWRKQTDHSWKCVVDAWNPDASLPKAAALPDPIVSSPTRPSIPAPVATRYGDRPAHYKEAIQNYFLEHLKDPGSVQYQEITEPEEGYTTAVTGGLLMRERRDYGWTVKVILKAKNSHGRYVGLKSYTFLFRGEKIIHTLSPLSEDELN